MLHGFPMDHSIWDLQAESLAARYRVITPDLRKIAVDKPAPGKVTVAQWADALAATLDMLKIDEPIVLGGLSMGGYIALQFFQSHRAARRADSLRYARSR